MSETVQGQRSPRWALWSRMTIPCQDGLVYLVRLRIVQTPWFGVYLHDIHEPDNDPHPHDHPWTFVSIVLRGGYHEELSCVWPGRRIRSWPHRWEKKRGRWSVHRMNQSLAHRITHVRPRTKTLVLVGPRRSEWGFYAPRFVPWQEYEARKGQHS